MIRLNKETDEVFRIIETARVNIGYTRKELCDKAGISRTAYTHYIRGLHSPGVDVVRLLLKAVNVPALVIHADGGQNAKLDRK